jgi:hypothetical protein
MNFSRRHLLALTVVSMTVCSTGLLSNPAYGATAEDLHRNASQALQTLYRTNEAAAKIGKIAKAALVFPNIVSLSIEGTKISRIKR